MIFKKIIYYCWGFGLATILFAPFLSTLVADWDHPYYERIEKTGIEYVKYTKELKEWEAKQAKLKKEQAKKVKKEKTVAVAQDSSNLKPLSYTVKVVFENEKASWTHAHALFFQKVCKLPWVPNIFWWYIMYAVLYVLWEKYFIRSDLYARASQTSHMSRPILIYLIFLSAMLVISIIVCHHVHLPDTLDRSVIDEITKNHNIDNAFTQNYLFMLVIGIFDLFIRELIRSYFNSLMEKIKRLANHLMVWYKKAFFVLTTPFLKSKLKIRNSKVTLTQTVLKFLWIVPYIQRKSYKITLTELLYYLRKFLLSQTSTKFLTQYKDNMLVNLKEKFVDFSQQNNAFLCGEPLPKDLRFVIKKGNKTIFVIQKEPQIHRVRFTPNVIRHEKEALKEMGVYDEYSDVIHEDKDYFDLSMPYCIFIVEFYKGSYGNFGAYWSKSALENIYDQISVCGLPNIDKFGSVCLGLEEENSFENWSMASICDHLIDHFWSSSFTLHLSENFKYVKSYNSCKTLYHWQKYSKDDLFFGSKLCTKTPYKDYDNGKGYSRSCYTINDLVKCMMEKESDIMSKIFDDFVDDVLFQKAFTPNILKEGDLQTNLDELIKIIENEIQKVDGNIH